MSTSNKLTYLNGTKQKLKQAINNIGGSIDDNTTFRQYANQLDDIYEVIPKTEYQSGSEVNLGKTIKGKLDFKKEYQEVEYIESTGTQYINTGKYIRTNNVRFEVKVKPTNNYTNVEMDLVSNQPNESGRFVVGYFNKKIFMYSRDDDIYDQNVWSQEIAETEDIIINANYDYTNHVKTLDVNGTSLSGSMYATISNSIQTLKFGLFTTTAPTFYGRWYYCKLYENNILTMELCPCYRISDNVIGLYDKVEGKFYTNAGTGTFTKGADVGNGFGDIVSIGQAEQNIDLTENNLTSQSVNDLTITVNADKSITINGTATANTTINILNNTSNNTPATERTLEAGTYQLTGCPSGSDSGTKFKLDVLRSGYIALLDSGSGDIKTLTSSQTYTYFRIQIFSGTVCNNLVFRPKLLKIPSPSYPQEIKRVRGKNLAHIEVEGKYRQYNSGTLVPNSNFNSYIANVQPNTTYITNCKNIASQYSEISNLCFFNSQMQYLSGLTYNTNDKVFTTPNNCYYVTMAVKVSLEEIQTEEGTQATPYLPYNTIEVRIRDELWGGFTPYTFNTDGVNFVTNADGSITASGTSTGIASSIVIDSALSNGIYKILKAGTYYIKCSKNVGNIQIYNTTTRTTFGTILSGDTLFTLTLTEETSVLIRLQVNSGITINDTVSINLYTEETTQQLSLGEYEFNGIGNYKDELIYDVENDKVYKNEKIGKFDIDSASFYNFHSVPQGTLFRTNDMNIIRNSTCLCNYYVCLTQSTRTNPCTYINLDNSYIDVIDNRFEATSQGLNNFRTWCKENGVVWYVPLQTPTQTEITDTTLINQVKALYNAHSNNGTTIITSNGDLPMIIKVRGLKGE